jgi:hypothetical protein
MSTISVPEIHYHVFLSSVCSRFPRPVVLWYSPSDTLAFQNISLTVRSKCWLSSHWVMLRHMSWRLKGNIDSHDQQRQMRTVTRFWFSRKFHLSINERWENYISIHRWFGVTIEGFEGKKIVSSEKLYVWTGRWTLEIKIRRPDAPLVRSVWPDGSKYALHP